MGISRGMIKLLMREGKNEKYAGNVLTAGRQDIYATADNIRKWAEEMEFHLASNLKIHISDKEGFREKSYITDETLFLALGFDKIDSMDYSDYEECTVVHDLNIDVPHEFHNRYDLIFDGGTSEHIFHLPKVLENYNRMLKVGGRIIHALPSSNHVDHGFYMFSPTLFVDYYSSNKWSITDSLFFQYFPQHDTKLWNIYSYMPGCLDRYSFGGFHKGMYGIFFVAQKTKKSTFNASVQQGSFLRTWNSSGMKPLTTDESTKSLWKHLFNLLPSRLRNIIGPIFYKVSCKFPARFYLKLVARF